jgi:hypothetical protein
VHGQDQYFNPRILHLDLASGFNPLEVGHGDVKDHQVGFQSIQEKKEFQAIGRFAYDLEIGVFLEDTPESFSNQVMIISQHNAVGIHGRLLSFEGMVKTFPLGVGPSCTSFHPSGSGFRKSSKLKLGLYFIFTGRLEKWNGVNHVFSRVDACIFSSSSKSLIHPSLLWPLRFASASLAYSMDVAFSPVIFSNRCFPPGSLKAIQYLILPERFAFSRSAPHPFPFLLVHFLLRMDCLLCQNGHSAKTAMFNLASTPLLFFKRCQVKYFDNFYEFQ